MNDTSSGTGVDCAIATDNTRLSTATPHAPAQHRGDGERDDGNRQQRGGHHTGRVIIEGLHPVVDRDAHRARFARNVPADHQDHTEFAQRVREGQN